MTVNKVKPYFVEDVLVILRSLVFASGENTHPEFIRAIISVALAFGISEKELKRNE